MGLRRGLIILLPAVGVVGMAYPALAATPSAAPAPAPASLLGASSHAATTARAHGVHNPSAAIPSLGTGSVPGPATVPVPAPVPVPVPAPASPPAAPVRNLLATVTRTVTRTVTGTVDNTLHAVTGTANETLGTLTGVVNGTLATVTGTAHSPDLHSPDLQGPVPAITKPIGQGPLGGLAATSVRPGSSHSQNSGLPIGTATRPLGGSAVRLGSTPDTAAVRRGVAPELRSSYSAMPATGTVGSVRSEADVPGALVALSIVALGLAATGTVSAARRRSPTT